MVCLALYAYIDLNYASPDSAPVNGESEQKKDNMETEEPPKSPAHEENNDNTPSSPNRWNSLLKQFALFFALFSVIIEYEYEGGYLTDNG